MTKDLLAVGIFTLAVSCIGISELLFHSGAAIGVILAALLAVGWLMSSWRKAGATKFHSGVPTGPTITDRSAVARLGPGRTSSSKVLAAVFIYVALLFFAGALATGGTMATVALMTFAILAAVAAVISSQFKPHP